VERRRRIEAYGLCRDDQQRVLLVPCTVANADPDAGDRWTLPGQAVAHGESPTQTLARVFAGTDIEIIRISQVISELDRQPEQLTHHDRLIFDVRLPDGDPTDGSPTGGGEIAGGRTDDGGGAIEGGGGTEGGGLAGARWVDRVTLGELTLEPFTAQAVGLALATSDEDPAAARPGADVLVTPNVVVVTPPARHQRFAAYGLVTDPAGRVLLARISEGYPGAGRWHLPGGGTDFGESATDGLLRELIEETAQRGRITGLLSVSHRHQRDAVGPERVAIDWHGVRVVFRAEVDQPTVPRVLEGNGSTVAASWFTPADALALDLTEVAYEAVAQYDSQ
jgi:8-oxo-dGTP diphosphatase